MVSNGSATELYNFDVVLETLEVILHAAVLVSHDQIEVSNSLVESKGKVLLVRKLEHTVLDMILFRSSIVSIVVCFY